MQICLLENEKKAKESHIATMEAVLENSKEELTFLEHQLGNQIVVLTKQNTFSWRDTMATCSSAGKQYLINYNPCSEIKFCT